MAGWRTRPAALVAAVLVRVGGLTGCSNSDARCESLKTSTALGVTGVVSAEFSCKSSFSGSQERGSVVVNAANREQAVAVMDEVLRAFAAEVAMVPTWRAPSPFTSEDGSIVVGPGDIGFNGLPWVSDLRDHYNIHPVR